MESNEGTVSRVLSMLRLLAESRGEQSVKSVAESLGLASSTAHRLLDQLVSHGFVERAPQRKYRVGREFLRLGAMTAQEQPAIEIARPVMRDVVDSCNETCLLGLYLPKAQKMTFVEKIDSRHPLRYRVRMYQLRSLAWGASGKAILASLPGSVIASILATAENSPCTGHSLPGSEHLQIALANIRKRGYAISKGEQTEGAIGLAAPIFGNDGRIFGDLCITIPEFRFNSRDESRLAKLLITQAQRLSVLLGQPNK